MGAHVPHQLDAIALFQADVRDDHIGIQFLDRDARVARRLRFSAHGEIVLVFHDAAQTLAHDGMVIDDQYPSHPSLAGHPGLGYGGTDPRIAGGHYSPLI